MSNLHIDAYHSIDPLVSYKGRYNRDSWKELKVYGTLLICVDTEHWLFDKNLRGIEIGNIVQSTNDGITYAVISVRKKEGTDITSSFTIQPLFTHFNWFGYKMLYRNILLDGNELPIDIKENTDE